MDEYAPRGGSALGDNARSTMVLTKLTDENANKAAPGCELPEDRDNLVVLAHAKSNGAMRAEPKILERASTPFGPVLRKFDLEPKKKADPAAMVDALVKVVARLTREGTDVTMTRVRDFGYCKEVGCSTKAVQMVFEDAVKAGKLEISPKTGRAGASIYVPFRADTRADSGRG
jgi:hypothetical protein